MFNISLLGCYFFSMPFVVMVIEDISINILLFIYFLRFLSFSFTVR